MVAQVEARACRGLFRDADCRRRVAERYREAEERARHDPFLPIALARFQLDMGDPGAGRRAALRALALEPESVLPRLLLADAFIEHGTPEDLARASALLGEARERGVAWEGWDGGPYGLRLLRADPRTVERLERKLAERQRGEASGER
jgi:hypothetical protein